MDASPVRADIEPLVANSQREPTVRRLINRIFGGRSCGKAVGRRL